MSEVVLEEVSQNIFGISGRHYRRLAQAGHVPVPVRGKIPLLEAIRDLCIYYRRLGERKELTLEHEKGLKIMAERKLKELNFELKSGELIARAEIPKLISEREKAVSAGLIGLWRSLSRKLVGKDARQMSEIIKGEVTHLLDELSRPRFRGEISGIHQLPV